MSTAAKDVKSVEEFDALLKSSQPVVVHFWAEWSVHCKHMDVVLVELAKTYPQVIFTRVEAEEVVDISEKYDVSSVPLFLIFKSGNVVERIEGADSAGLTKKVKEIAGKPVTPAQSGKPEDVNARITELLASAPMLLFMKGSPDAPKCKFSSKVTGILRDVGLTYKHFDILEDEEIRQGLKEYSKWPTFPQLYVDQELVGGCDIITEMAESGELAEMLQEKTGTEGLNARLEKLVKSQPVMLFMKGNPDGPQCGFSSRVVEMLKTSGVEFGHFDILQDEVVRQGLKEFSKWPTFPQLYAKGELVGGCDIITELHEAGELASTIQDALQN
ncbi:hypothetical protein BSKO_07923 [Bryopsis sp. KO-2023]|nr:hypothetical protein BSKO_07923 [Bryopsis sp. KO-2023]